MTPADQAIIAADQVAASVSSGPTLGAWAPVIGLVALVLGALLSALYQSLRDYSGARLEELAAKTGSPAASRRAVAINDDALGHGAAVALPRIVCNLVVAAAAVLWTAELAGATSPSLMQVAWWQIVTALLGVSLLIWVFGLVVPVSIAEHAAERTILAMSPLLRGAYAAVAPMRIVLVFFDELVRRLVGNARRTDAEEIEEELRHVVEEAERGGHVDETERDMIESVVELRHTTVEQIMTPRTEVQALEYTDDLNEVKQLIDERGHSRVPVYEDNLDHVIGILYAKDLLRFMIAANGDAHETFVLRDIVRPATFVPETKTVRELLTELLAAQVHVAMVADEYGGTAGLVTIEDIVEEIFGEIRDEYEPALEQGEVELFEGERAADIDARAHIDDANDRLEPLGVSLPEGDDYDTVGGFVITTLGRIPEAGESLDHEGLRLTVTEAEPTRVKRVRLELVAAREESRDEPRPSENGSAETGHDTPAT